MANSVRSISDGNARLAFSDGPSSIINHNKSFRCLKGPASTPPMLSGVLSEGFYCHVEVHEFHFALS